GGGGRLPERRPGPHGPLLPVPAGEGGLPLGAAAAPAAAPGPPGGHGNGGGGGGSGGGAGLRRPGGDQVDQRPGAGGQKALRHPDGDGPGGGDRGGAV